MPGVFSNRVPNEYDPPTEPLSPETLDAQLYILRRLIENAVADSDLKDSETFYVCSLDRRKIVYKGLLTNAQVRSYYPELSDERVRSTLALVHSAERRPVTLSANRDRVMSSWATYWRNWLALVSGLARNRPARWVAWRS